MWVFPVVLIKKLTDRRPDRNRVKPPTAHTVLQGSLRIEAETESALLDVRASLERCEGCNYDFHFAECRTRPPDAQPAREARINRAQPHLDKQLAIARKNLHERTTTATHCIFEQEYAADRLEIEADLLEATVQAVSQQEEEEEARRIGRLANVPAAAARVYLHGLHDKVAHPTMFCS
eukprot:GHVU01121767.1.p1 GENE.GHVU01121767.1~~GHVU01121767.1.p1  ORF type:complete len:178 (+),score=18.21 GHVU01121767.1:739-1272(+)